MGLTSGTRVGPYEILSAIGAGGMGEVYRARDTRLDRDVAIKILPEAFAADAERVARFQREAKVLASLNHPNIAIIHGLEHPDGAHALVMELVEGEDLAQRIVRGAIPLDEALPVAKQIAEALEAAHEQGIIHRDLKPANIKVRADGVVKVLDFGLAKAMEPTGAMSASNSMSPTITSPAMTQAGMILGTAAYMSPEQARGKTADKRADVWAFGAVLFEMLTGKRAFPGEDITDTIVSVISKEPDWRTLPAAAPAGLRRLLARCLKKDPKARLQAIGEARVHIDELLSGAPEEIPGAPSVPAALPAPLPRSAWSRALPWTLAASTLVFAVAWVLVKSTEVPSTTLQFQRVTDFVGMEDSPAISPDGKTVAFVARAGSRLHIWIRLLAGGVPFQLTRDDADREQPRWTPDSNSLIYYTPSETLGEEGAIWEIPALGGSPRRIASALGGGDVSHDGRRIALFEIEGGQPSLAVVARDGSREALVKQLPAGASYELPRWSPDDRWIAFQSTRAMVYETTLYVIRADGGEAQEVARANLLRGFSWLADNSGLVYSSSFGSTVAYPPVFNLRTVTRDGEGDRQLTSGDLSYVSPDVHKSGKLLASRVKSQSNVWRFPVQGSAVVNTRGAFQITRQTGQAQTPSVSPDGREFVYLSDSGGHGNLWVAQADGSGVRQLTFEKDPGAFVGVPVWSPAGNQIAFIQTRSGKTEQWLIQSDGNGLRQLVTNAVWACWSGDGRWLYYGASRQGNYCIDKVPANGGQPVAVRCDSAFSPAVASDGSVLYFASPVQRDGWPWDWEVRSASPESGPSRVLARIAGSRIPVEALNIQTILSPDGKSLAIPLTDRGTSNLWAIPAAGGPMRRLTDFGEQAVIIARRVSWSPDGKYIYAAVNETDADVVMLEGLLK